MNSQFLGRELGNISYKVLQQDETNRLLLALDAAPQIKFDGRDAAVAAQEARGFGTSDKEDVWAHRAGVNKIVIDQFEGRYLLSGGADSNIKLWDLESVENTLNRFTYRPERVGQKTSSSHQFGVTHLSFYPFDSLAFLSSSYDHTLKVHATETLTPSASFDLGSIIYSHGISPIADHLLVACATQHPAVRLVDLRSGASTHSLAGHQGAVLSVTWSPLEEYILASGGSDGTVRLWDIRRSASSMGVMDLEDSVGIGGEDGLGKSARPRERGKAHIGACNGVVWTEDGKFLLSTGHDERVRVWDVGLGANALSHFGPIIKNTLLSTLLPMLAPTDVVAGKSPVMLYPNEREILMFDLFEGTLLKRIRIPGIPVAQAHGSAGQRNVKSRVTSLAWRADNIQMYSSHSDGVIRAWLPRTNDDVKIDEDEDAKKDDRDSKDSSRKRKREALENIFNDLTKQKIIFS